MECNKDDASKAKEIAEKKLLEGDITGAKNFALKARNMFPNLDGLSQFIEVIDVYICREKKIHGETNYYGILEVDPSSSEDVLRKQYKRRALALHPDKNKSIGADGAFKILSEAWSVLSDKDKKHAYDLKLNIQATSNLNSNSSFNSSTSTTSTPHVPTNSQNPEQMRYPSYTHPPQHNHHHQNKYFSFSNPQPSPRYENTSQTEYNPMNRTTFWTCCHRCRIQFEYQKIYLNQNLRCIDCKQPFLATEIPTPDARRPRVRLWPYPQQQQQSVHGSGLGSKPAESDSCQPSSERLKRRHMEEGDIPMDVPEKGEASAASGGLNRDYADEGKGETRSDFVFYKFF